MVVQEISTSDHRFTKELQMNWICYV